MHTWVNLSAIRWGINWPFNPNPSTGFDKCKINALRSSKWTEPHTQWSERRLLSEFQCRNRITQQIHSKDTHNLYHAAENDQLLHSSTPLHITQILAIAESYQNRVCAQWLPSCNSPGSFNGHLIRTLLPDSTNAPITRQEAPSEQNHTTHRS